jgi:type I restriction enzyme, S subunit
MELKPGYKHTALGVIPDDWSTAALGDLGEALIGLTYKPEDVREHGTLVLRSSNIQEGALRFDDNVFVQTRIPERLMVRTGDILICVRNGSRDLIGKSALRDGRRAGMTFGAFMAVFRSPVGRFLSYVFESDILKRQINEHLGATINQITNKSLNTFQVPLPSTDTERSTIAVALSDVDALLDGLGKLIAKKRDLKEAAMQQLLIGRTRLPGFEGKWEQRRIADIASVVVEKNIAGAKLPVLACSKHFGFVDSLGFFKNQVFSKDLSTYRVVRRHEIGYPANHVEEGSIGLQDSYDVALVSPIYVVFKVAENVSSFFLHRLLKLDSFRQRFKAATTSSVDRRGSLRWPAFSEITITLPPTKDEQNAIAAVLSDMESELSALEARREKTRCLKQAMMQQLLTGRTRLVPGSTTDA